jgi:hypothetical protein
MNKEFLKMQKLAGLITENQMREMMNTSDEVPLTPEVQQYIDDAIDELRKSLPSEEWAKLDGAGFWESEFPEGVWMQFQDEFPDALDVSEEVKDYIESKVYKSNFDIVDRIVNNNFPEVTDYESLQDAIEYTDLVDAVADEMGGDFTKARQALEDWGKKKFGGA